MPADEFVFNNIDITIPLPHTSQFAGLSIQHCPVLRVRSKVAKSRSAITTVSKFGLHSPAIASGGKEKSLGV